MKARIHALEHERDTIMSPKMEHMRDQISKLTNKVNIDQVKILQDENDTLKS